MQEPFSYQLGEKVSTLLKHNVEGHVHFDPYTRGRYSTDASIYQIAPFGVVVPKTTQDLVSAVEIAAEHNIPILPRGGGTSQCGQTVNEAIVIDCSQYLNKIVNFDYENMRISVEPGIVLDHLNSYLKPHNLFFPVDLSLIHI